MNITDKQVIKINKEPIEITISGVGFTHIQNGEGFRLFFKTRLWGTGASIEEINVIADAVRDGKIIFVDIDDKGTRQGYLNGKLIETPTQHIYWKGAIVSLATLKEEHTPSFDDWVVGVIKGSDELESHYVNKQLESLSLFYIDGTEDILYHSNA